jgi:hypothetical protein
MNRPDPIYFKNEYSVAHLMHTIILATEEEYGIGYYGTLIGVDDTTKKFIIKTCNTINLSSWISDFYSLRVR